MINKNKVILLIIFLSILFILALSFAIRIYLVSRSSRAETAPDTGQTYVFAGAGDIGSIDGSGDEEVAQVLDNIVAQNPDVRLFTAGDNVNEDFVYYQHYLDYFQPTWGRHKARIRPVPGNHDYTDANTGGVASGYFQYFGTAAGEQGKGYYSYDIGNNWHIIALNSICEKAGGCGEGSPQGIWLRQDLEANKTKACLLAYWHYPRYSSGTHDNNPSVQYFWETLYQYGADVVVNGHSHAFERFAKQTPSGIKSDIGIREFVVGTGGKDGLNLNFPQAANEEVRNASSLGVIKFTLKPDRYAWNFVPVAGKTFTDSGETICNNANRASTPTSTPSPTPIESITPTPTPGVGIGNSTPTSTPALDLTVAPPTVTNTPVPTETPLPTATSTPVPTSTLVPTATYTPVPTSTPRPTYTIQPTYTVQPPYSGPTSYVVKYVTSTSSMSSSLDSSASAVTNITVNGQKPGIAPWMYILGPIVLVLVGVFL